MREQSGLCIAKHLLFAFIHRNDDAGWVHHEDRIRGAIKEHTIPLFRFGKLLRLGSHLLLQLGGMPINLSLKDLPFGNISDKRTRMHQVTRFRINQGRGVNLDLDRGTVSREKHRFNRAPWLLGQPLHVFKRFRFPLGRENVPQMHREHFSQCES